ncbi:uncharacterized protein LOC143485053 isoform X2 [Brachyhypopomus gauderio]
MASPQKNGSLELQGYIHEVSDLKQEVSSNKWYFTTVLQEADRSSHVVVFAPHQHSFFKRAKHDRSPVMLANIALRPSRQNEQSNDILLNHKSRLSCLRQLNFSFYDHRRTKDIIENPVEYQRVNVSVSVKKARNQTQTTCNILSQLATVVT